MLKKLVRACLLGCWHHTTEAYHIVSSARLKGMAVVRPKEAVLVIVEPAPASD